jgi:hypothetical protein
MSGIAVIWYAQKQAIISNQSRNLAKLCVITYHYVTCIGGVMVSVLASSAVDRRFKPRLGQPKDYKITQGE